MIHKLKYFYLESGIDDKDCILTQIESYSSDTKDRFNVYLSPSTVEVPNSIYKPNWTIRGELVESELNGSSEIRYFEAHHAKYGYVFGDFNNIVYSNIKFGIKPVLDLMAKAEIHGIESCDDVTITSHPSKKE